MTTTLTIRLPAALARQLKDKARSEKTNPTVVLRKAAEKYVGRKTNSKQSNALQEHIEKYAGRWDGDLSGEELLRKTRP